MPLHFNETTLLWALYGISRYKPGDLSTIVTRLAPDGTVAEVVQVALRNTGSVQKAVGVWLADPTATYMVTVLNLLSAPAAAASRTMQPFKIRFCCNSPLDVTPAPFSQPRHGTNVLRGLHLGLAAPVNKAADLELCANPPLKRIRQRLSDTYAM